MEDQEDELIELMEFLAQYVRVVHCNRFFMNKLFLNKGKSYVEVLTASDIAYAITLVKNSHEVWKHKFQNNGDAGGKKPLYSSGEGKKREHGESTWSADGIKYFQKTEKAWTDAFREDSRAHTILTIYWKKWIEDEGMTFSLGGTNQGMKNKTAISILRTRKEGETNMSTKAKQKVIEPVDEEEFHYESEADDNGIVDVGEWSARKGPRPRKEKVVHDIDDDESGEDEDSSDDDDDSLGGAGGNDDDDMDNEKGNNDDDVNIEQEDDGDDDERSLNGIQQLMEDEAVAAGMAKTERLW